MMICMLIDFLIGMSDKSIIVAYVILYGFASYFFELDIEASDKYVNKLNVSFLAFLLVLCLLLLILIKEEILIIANTSLIGIIQIMLSLIISVIAIIIMSIVIKQSEKKRKN